MSEDENEVEGVYAASENDVIVVVEGGHLGLTARLGQLMVCDCQVQRCGIACCLLPTV